MCGPPRSSLSSKSLAASICITYASGATVCYTIGIHLVGLMTGTKGDDAMRRRDHLRYASLFSLSPFFSPFAFVYRPKYAFILKRYLVSRLDEISVTGTSNRNDSNSFGVFFFFFSESRRTSGGKATEKWTGGNSIRADFLPWKYRIPRNATGLDPRYRESTLADTQNDPRLVEPVIRWKRSWPRNVPPPPP